MLLDLHAALFLLFLIFLVSFLMAYSFESVLLVVFNRWSANIIDVAFKFSGYLMAVDVTSLVFLQYLILENQFQNICLLFKDSSNQFIPWAQHRIFSFKWYLIQMHLAWFSGMLLLLILLSLTVLYLGCWPIVCFLNNLWQTFSVCFLINLFKIVWPSDLV